MAAPRGKTPARAPRPTRSPHQIQTPSRMRSARQAAASGSRRRRQRVKRSMAPARNGASAPGGRARSPTRGRSGRRGRRARRSRPPARRRRRARRGPASTARPSRANRAASSCAVTCRCGVRLAVGRRGEAHRRDAPGRETAPARRTRTASRGRRAGRAQSGCVGGLPTLGRHEDVDRAQKCRRGRARQETRELDPRLRGSRQPVERHHRFHAPPQRRRPGEAFGAVASVRASVGGEEDERVHRLRPCDRTEAPVTASELDQRSRARGVVVGPRPGAAVVAVREDEDRIGCRAGNDGRQVAKADAPESRIDSSQASSVAARPYSASFSPTHAAAPLAPADPGSRSG